MSEAATAVIENGEIIIRMPIANLDSALEGAWASGCQDGHYKVTDAAAFAKEVVYELNREDEIGTTPIHTLLDRAMYAAIDQGSEGFREATPEEDEV